MTLSFFRLQLVPFLQFCGEVAEWPYPDLAVFEELSAPDPCFAGLLGELQTSTCEGALCAHLLRDGDCFVVSRKPEIGVGCISAQRCGLTVFAGNQIAVRRWNLLEFQGFDSFLVR